MAFNADSIIFNNTPSEMFELYVGSIGSKDGKASDSGSTNTKVVYDVVNNENFIYGIELKDTMAKLTIELYCERELRADEVADIDQWLCNNHEFKSLVICQPDMVNYEYKAFCEGYDKIKIGGKVYGFKCKFVCDSLYAYALEETKTYKINGTTKIRFLNLDNGFSYLRPATEFTCTASNGTITIVNKSDNNRTFVIEGLTKGETIKIDKYGQLVSSLGILRVGNCNKKFLRLKNGVNDLEISGNLSEFKMTYRFRRAIGT